MSLSFEKRLLIGFALILCSVLFLAHAASNTNKRYRDTFFWVKHTQDILFLSKKVQTTVKDMQRAVSGYVITGDSAFLVPYAVDRKIIFGDLDSLKTLSAYNQLQLARIDSLSSLIKRNAALLQQVLQTRNLNGFEAAQTLIKPKRGLGYMVQIDTLVSQIQRDQKKLLQLREEDNQDSIASFNRFFLLQTGALILGTLVFSLLLYFSLRARRKAENELFENKQLLQFVFDKGSSLIYIKDLEGRYTMVNEHFQKELGLPYNQIVGSTLFDLFPKETAEKLWQSDKRVLNEKKIVEVHDEIKFKDSSITLYTVKFPLTNATGELTGICGIDTNISSVILEKRLQRLKQMNEAAIEAQEKERSEIGKELHDNVNQLLATAKIMLDTAIDIPDMRDMAMQKSRGVIMQAITEIRNISHAMLPPDYTEETFTESMHKMVADLNMSRQLHFEMKVTDENVINGLPDSSKLALYRICQEQTTNILKYSGAKQVSVLLRAEKEEVLLIVADDGRGFDPTIKAKGIGLKNITRRAEALNGEMEIKTAPGKGCTLIVRLPLFH